MIYALLCEKISFCSVSLCGSLRFVTFKPYCDWGSATYDLWLGMGLVVRVFKSRAFPWTKKRKKRDIFFFNEFAFSVK